MAGNIQAVPGWFQRVWQSDLIFKATQLTEVITQIAVRALFIAANVLMAAAAVPMSLHGVVVTVVAIGSTALAGFFFPNFTILQGPLFGLMKPLVLPVRLPANGEIPAGYPENGPRGFIREGQNCALNASAQVLDSAPQIAQWLRNPISQDIDMPAFLNFLAEYDVRPHLVAQFTAHVDAQPHPQMPIPTMFDQFLQNYQPPEADRDAFAAFKGTFENLRILHGPFSEFYRAKDAAVHARQMVSQGNSQNLRLAASQASVLIDPSSRVQLDAVEFLELVYGILPNRLKTRIETVRHMNTAGLPAIAEPPLPKEDRVPFISVALNPDRPNASLPELINGHCNNTRNEPAKYTGVDGVRREYPVERETVSFLEASPGIGFQIMRFEHEKPAVSWLSRWLPWVFPPQLGRAVKRESPVEIPERMTITLKNGQVCNYQLTSFLNHHGSYGGGHYTSAETVDNHKYMMDDTLVTLVDPAHPEQWNQALRQAYFVWYQLVPPAPAHA